MYGSAHASGGRPAHHASRRLAMQVVAASLVTALGAAPVGAALDGDVELMRHVAMAIRSNRERILTWQGKAHSQSLTIIPDGRVTDEVDAAFVFDRTRDARRWNMNIARAGGEAGPSAEILNEMKKEGVFYRYAPGYIRGDKIENALVIAPPGNLDDDRLGFNSFDPTWYLTVDGHDQVETLLFHHENAKQPWMSAGNVARTGDRVVLETRSQGSVNRREFDLAVGGNLVSFYAEDDRAATRTSITYGKAGDVWLPKTYSTERLEGSGKAKALTMSRKAEFIESVINEPVPESAFSLEALGVRVRDPVSDHRVGIHYRYGGGDEVEHIGDMDAVAAAATGVVANTSAVASVAEHALPDRPIAVAGVAPHAVEAGSEASPAGAWRRPLGAAFVALALATAAYLLVSRKSKA